MSTVITKIYGDVPLCKQEIFRYAGARADDGAVTELLSSALSEVREALSYRVCYIEAELCVYDEICDFGFFKIRSKDLSKNLADCEKAVIFAATVGIGIDRLITKYSRLSPSRALMLQAIGAERIEALCDRFYKDIKNEHPSGIRPRYSPGYGDLPLEVQKDVFKLLEAPKRIGISLNESMLMTPTKSVTAFIGIKK